MINNSLGEKTTKEEFHWWLKTCMLFTASKCITLCVLAGLASSEPRSSLLKAGKRGRDVLSFFSVKALNGPLKAKAGS